MTATDFLICPRCLHLTSEHGTFAEATYCKGVPRVFPSEDGQCNCARTSAEAVGANMALFARVLQCDHAAVHELVTFYDADARPLEDEALARAEFLRSDVGCRLWNLYLHEETPRTDALGERLSKLACAFPTLDRAVTEDGLLSDGWSSRELELHACNTDGAERHAALFVLGVWDRHQAWAVGHFNFLHAFSKWDKEHRAAFVAWVEDPWWA